MILVGWCVGWCVVCGAGLGFVVECGGECDLGVGVCRFVLARVRRARSCARDLSWRLWAEECGARGLNLPRYPPVTWPGSHEILARARRTRATRARGIAPHPHPQRPPHPGNTAPIPVSTTHPQTKTLLLQPPRFKPLATHPHTHKHPHRPRTTLQTQTHTNPPISKHPGCIHTTINHTHLTPIQENSHSPAIWYPPPTQPIPTVANSHPPPSQRPQHTFPNHVVTMSHTNLLTLTNQDTQNTWHQNYPTP